jgi:hypothetical protein
MFNVPENSIVLTTNRVQMVLTKSRKTIGRHITQAQTGFQEIGLIGSSIRTVPYCPRGPERDGVIAI